jgi:prolyl 4-hydroxylase
MSASLVTSYGKPLSNQRSVPSDRAKGCHLKSKDLTSLDARVNGLFSKANRFPLWVKPACYTALAISGLGAMALIGITLFPSQASPTLPPPFRKSTTFGDVEVETLSETPRIYRLPNFLSNGECERLINLAKDKLTPSMVVDNDDQKGNGVLSPARTSKGYFLEENDRDETVRKIEKLIVEVTGIPIENGEPLHVLQYPLNGKYEPHHDYFDADSAGGKAALDRGGQRVATVIMYLNTPQKGGETSFPDASIKVTAKKGDAVFFHNVLPSGVEDPLTLHGGDPVLEGEKWIATRWVRKSSF